MYAGSFHSCDGDVASLSCAAIQTAQSELCVSEQNAGSDLFQHENNKRFVY
jgi:hypothetical protein